MLENFYKLNYQIQFNLQSLLVESELENDDLLFEPVVGFSDDLFKQNTNQDTDESYDNFNSSQFIHKIDQLNKKNQQMLKLFEHVNQERLILREQNFNLTQKLFMTEQNTNDKDFQAFMKKSILVNYEFFKKQTSSLLDKNEELKQELDIKSKDNQQLQHQLDKLEIKLKKERDNFKQYLTNGTKTNQTQSNGVHQQQQQAKHQEEIKADFESLPKPKESMLSSSTTNLGKSIQVTKTSSNTGTKLTTTSQKKDTTSLKKDNNTTMTQKKVVNNSSVKKSSNNSSQKLNDSLQNKQDNQKSSDKKPEKKERQSLLPQNLVPKSLKKTKPQIEIPDDQLSFQSDLLVLNENDDLLVNHSLIIDQNSQQNNNNPTFNKENLQNLDSKVDFSKKT